MARTPMELYGKYVVVMLLLVMLMLCKTVVHI